MDRIRKVSRFCQVCFFIIFLLLPIFTAFFWVFINELHAAYRYSIFLNIGSKQIDIFTNWPITWNLKVTGLMGSLIYTYALMVIFYFLTKLFGLYARGQIFTRENIRYIRLIGYVYILKPLLAIPTQHILSFVMHMNNPIIKERYTHLDINEILIGLMIILVSWVMDEGRKLKEEQDLTV